MIGGINVDDAGQKRFEAELNKLYGGIMTQFRREFHDLLDETDIRFFSCVVARFEASIILRIFNYCCPLKVSEQRDIHPQCCCNGIADDFSEGKPLS